MKIRNVKILQICPAPGRLADRDGNIYAGYALIEFTVQYRDQDGPDVVQEIVPFGTEGGLIFGVDIPHETLYYGAHGLGDNRPPFADFFDSDGRIDS